MFSGCIVISIFDPSGATNCMTLLFTGTRPDLLLSCAIPLNQFLITLTGEAGFDSISVVVPGVFVRCGVPGAS